jgi:hypothetical protein
MGGSMIPTDNFEKGVLRHHLPLEGGIDELG